MGDLQKDIFICLDCEATGLDAENDRIIEVAAVQFTKEKIIDKFETLIDPECEIPISSQKIHNISQEMIKGKPKIDEILPALFKFINNFPIIGHGINFDISILTNSAKRTKIPCSLHLQKTIDTLRLARLYGESPINSLEMLRAHFNIQPEGAHRAMNDVVVNVEVFKHLTSSYKTTETILERLKKPIRLKAMPLGKHKGRRFEEIPVEYLVWAAKKDFDQDLLFSIRSELKSRRKGQNFEQAANPFSSL